MGDDARGELETVELTGTHLALRPWRPDDAPRVEQIMQDRSMHSFLGLPDPYTADDARRFVSHIGPGGRADGSGFGSAVVERSSQRLVGSAQLQFGYNPEVGFWIAPDARGHGYAAAATRLLADLAFDRLALPCLRLGCDVRNVASARTALACGFSFEGVVRSGLLTRGYDGTPGRRGPLARFGLLPEDARDPIGPAFAPLPRGGLDDGVLQLRVLEPDDAAEATEVQDEVAQQFSFTGRPRDPDQVREESARAGLDWLVGPAARLVMIDIATGAYAGELSLARPGPPRVGRIGYAVHPLFRGRGYTARALRLLAPWAFGVGRFARLELGARVDNVASRRAAEAGGFGFEAVFRARLHGGDGRFHDEARYALLPADPPGAAALRG